MSVLVRYGVCLTSRTYVIHDLCRAIIGCVGVSWRTVIRIMWLMSVWMSSLYSMRGGSGGGGGGEGGVLKNWKQVRFYPWPPPPPHPPHNFFYSALWSVKQTVSYGAVGEGGGGDCGMPWRLSVATTYSVLIQLLPCSFFRLCKFKICSMQYDCCTVISSLWASSRDLAK